MSTFGRIPFVEDDSKNVELTSTAFEDYSMAHKVVVAEDRPEALDCMYREGTLAGRSGEKSGVLLPDLKLPKIDGLEVLRQSPSDEKLKMTPAVVLTSSHEEKDVVLSYRHSVNACVARPVDFHELVNAIKKLGDFWAVINQPPPGSVTKN